MLDDSLTAGRHERPAAAKPLTATVSSTHDPALIRSPDPDEPRQLEIGDRFAGFQVRGILGRGAMGVVYEAWDPTLERRVALKLLRSPTRRAAERLLREARALARLDHPGVVRIWAADVHLGAVYIAMELIEGQNLREWLETPRSWTEVLPVLIGAGRGLAAAHAAGVVHRDFKPENVLVGWDGQARVLDFGIARIGATHPEHLTHTGDGEDEVEVEAEGEREREREAEGEDEGEGEDEDEASCGASQPTGSFAGVPIEGAAGQLTEVGSLIGTLMYMSPEQHAREPADERSDQYSFCATLFEAVYGRQPFPARTPEQLAERVTEARLHVLESGKPKVPRWLEKVILKGLESDRQDRYADMDELIDALERHPSRRRRRDRVLTVAAVALAAVGLGVMVPRGEQQDPCVDVGGEFEATLGSEARARIAERFTQIGQPWATRMGERVDATLGNWGARWIEARTNVCRTRHEHREATIIDERREACLASQLGRIEALGAVLTHVDDRKLIDAEHMLAALPEPEVCLGDAPPEDHTRLAGHEALGEELAQLVFLSLAQGSDDELRDRAERLVEQARALPHDDESQALLADALIILAQAQILDGDRGPAEQGLREAARMAERIAADGIRARAIVNLGWTLATAPGRAREAVQVLDDASALAERIGSPRFETLRLRQALGEASLAIGDTARARELFESLLTEHDRGHVPHSTTLMGLSRVAAAEGDFTRALEFAEQAFATVEDTVGSDHFLLASPLTNIGQAQVGRGEHAVARAAFERAASLRRRQVDTASTPGSRSRLAEVLILLANLDSSLGNAEAAADGYREALALVPEHDYNNRALVLFNLGVDHQIAGRSEQALANYQEALRLAERVHSMDHPLVVGARLGVGSTLVSLDRPAEARAPLERSLADWPDSMRNTADEGELRFALARALQRLEGRSAKVDALCDEAVAIYRRLGMTGMVDEIGAWQQAGRSLGR